ncbi:hypothetical protein MferCBS31731_004448 [Microsporum ferrugineum]
MDHEIQQERAGLLGGLSSDTNEYRYPGLDGVKVILSREYDRFLGEHKSPHIVFTHIPQSEVDIIDSERLGRIDYHSSLQTLVITMPSLPHEEASRLFCGLVVLKAQSMGVRRLISFRGSTTTKAREREKQADESWGPRQRRGQPGKWPTIVLEVAFSESREKVKADISWWLYRSNGAVLKAISIDIKRTSGNVYITLWERGAILTRQHPQPEPRVVGEMRICRGMDGRPTRVEGADLTIPFHDMLLRAPDTDWGEGDFIFTKEELLELAEDVWDDMEQLA